MAGERAIVVGSGGISPEWFSALAAEHVDVRAVVVRDQLHRAARRVEPYGFDCELSTDLDAALSAHKPDFVVDLTPPSEHCAVTCASLRAGAHVLGEKPMAAKLSEAQEMVRVSEETGRMFMVSQSARWAAENEAMRRAIDAGSIGEVHFLACDWYIAVHLDDFRKTMESPVLVEGAIHQLDLARFLTGAEPEAVYGMEFNPRSSWFEGDASVSCIFEMTNGIVFSFNASFCAEGCFSSGLGHWRVIGEKGTICLGKDQKPYAEGPAGTGEIMWPQRVIDIPAVDVRKPRMHGALSEMLEFIRTGHVPQTECHDNLKSMAMISAVTESARKRQRITISV